MIINQLPDIIAYWDQKRNLKDEWKQEILDPLKDKYFYIQGREFASALVSSYCLFLALTGETPLAFLVLMARCYLSWCLSPRPLCFSVDTLKAQTASGPILPQAWCVSWRLNIKHNQADTCGAAPDRRQVQNMLGYHLCQTLYHAPQANNTLCVE